MCSAKAPHLGAIPLFVKRGVHNFLCTVACLLVCKQTLTVTLEGEKLAALPVGTHGRATFVAAMSLGPQTTVLPASRSDTTELAVLHHRCADPVDARIVANSFVGRIHHHNLKVLESGILVHPVGVSTRKLPHLRAARSSATLRSERRAFKWLIPALRGLPYTWPLWTGRLRPPRRMRTDRCSIPAWPCIRHDAPC